MYYFTRSPALILSSGLLLASLSVSGCGDTTPSLPAGHPAETALAELQNGDPRGRGQLHSN